MKPSVQSIYIADGFADDCDELIQKCLLTETLNYQIFCNIWKDSKFVLTFQGRSSGPELAELSEEFLHIAKRYMVGNTSNFEESVAGVFLVYALIHTQPYPKFAKLRITPQDLDAIHLIEEIARAHKRWDVLYILGSLLIMGPVEYQLTEREYGLENALRKGFNLCSSIDRTGVRPKGVLFRQNEELDLLRELTCLDRRYLRAKALVHGTYRPDKTLDYVNETMAADALKSLKQLINGFQEEAPTAETKNRGDDMQTIKQQAMKKTVNEMRHLRSTASSLQIEERFSSKTVTNDVEATIEEFELDKPKPRKIKKKCKKRSCIKLKNYKLFDSDSNLDLNMPTLGEDTGDDISEIMSEDETLPKNYDETQSDIVNQIDLSKIPAVNSLDGDDSFIEIEIIDQYSSNGKSTTTCEVNGNKIQDHMQQTKKGKGNGKNRKIAETKLNFTESHSQNNDKVTKSAQIKEAEESDDNIDILKENNDDNLRDGRSIKFITNNIKADETDSSDSETLPILLDRKDKKKTILKSKLNRLGILPVADLKYDVTNSPKRRGGKRGVTR